MDPSGHPGGRAGRRGGAHQGWGCGLCPRSARGQRLSEGSFPGRLFPGTITAKPQGLCDRSHFTDKKSKAQRLSCTIAGSELGLSDVKATERVDLKVQREGPPSPPCQDWGLPPPLTDRAHRRPRGAVLTRPQPSRLATEMRVWMSGPVCPGALGEARAPQVGAGPAPTPAPSALRAALAPVGSCPPGPFPASPHHLS